MDTVLDVIMNVTAACFNPQATHMFTNLLHDSSTVKLACDVFLSYPMVVFFFSLMVGIVKSYMS